MAEWYLKQIHFDFSPFYNLVFELYLLVHLIFDWLVDTEKSSIYLLSNPITGI